MRGTVVDIVTDDMPFVVDSVTTEVIRHGLGLHPEMSSPVCRTALREELNRRVSPSSAHKAAAVISPTPVAGVQPAALSVRTSTY